MYIFYIHNWVARKLGIVPEMKASIELKDSVATSEQNTIPVEGAWCWS